MKKSVVLKIILINFFIFGLINFLSIWGIHLENLLALYPLSSKYFNLFQIITHLFTHYDPEHIFFNMLVFFLVGPDVEKYFGDKFLKFYILSGIFSSGLYCIGATSAIIGASGAIFATVGASILITFKNENFKNFISLKFKNLFFILIVLTEIYYAITETNDQIGHWAHIFGVIFGIIYFIKFEYDKPKY